jgi:hypothetical protein
MGTVSEQEIPAYYYIHELSCLPGDGELWKVGGVECHLFLYEWNSQASQSSFSVF